MSQPEVFSTKGSSFVRSINVKQYFWWWVLPFSRGKTGFQQTVPSSILKMTLNDFLNNIKVFFMCILCKNDLLKWFPFNQYLKYRDFHQSREGINYSSINQYKISLKYLYMYLSHTFSLRKISFTGIKI